MAEMEGPGTWERGRWRALPTHETPERRKASGGRVVWSADALRYAYCFSRGSLGRRMRHLR